jgi:hypothetical protein
LNGLKLTIDALKKAGTRNIVLIGPDPTWNDALPRILTSYYLKQHKRSPLRMKDNNSVTAHILDAAMRNFAELQNIRFVSSLDILCNQDGCLTRTDSNSTDYMAVDINHLTPQGAKYEASILMDLIKPTLFPN